VLKPPPAVRTPRPTRDPDLDEATEPRAGLHAVRRGPTQRSGGGDPPVRGRVRNTGGSTRERLWRSTADSPQTRGRPPKIFGSGSWGVGILGQHADQLGQFVFSHRRNHRPLRFGHEPTPQGQCNSVQWHARAGRRFGRQGSDASSTASPGGGAPAAGKGVARSVGREGCLGALGAVVRDSGTTARSCEPLEDAVQGDPVSRCSCLRFAGITAPDSAMCRGAMRICAGCCIARKRTLRRLRAGHDVGLRIERAEL